MRAFLRMVTSGHVTKIAKRPCYSLTTWLYLLQNRSYGWSKFYIAGIGIFDLFCFCYFDFDPMTFIYELDPYSLEIYRMCKYELFTSRLSKVIVWQTDRDRQTRPNDIPRSFAGGQLNNAVTCCEVNQQLSYLRPVVGAVSSELVVVGGDEPVKRMTHKQHLEVASDSPVVALSAAKSVATATARIRIANGAVQQTQPRWRRRLPHQTVRQPVTSQKYHCISVESLMFTQEKLNEKCDRSHTTTEHSWLGLRYRVVCYSSRVLEYYYSSICSSPPRGQTLPQTKLLLSS